MTVSRSREVVPKTLPPPPPPPPSLEPATPWRTDAASNPAVPSTSSAAVSSSPSALGLGFEPSLGAAGGRRRSLRLASLAKSSPGGYGSSGSRKRCWNEDSGEKKSGRGRDAAVLAFADEKTRALGSAEGKDGEHQGIEEERVGASASLSEEKGLKGDGMLDLNCSPGDGKKRVWDTGATPPSSPDSTPEEQKDEMFMHVRSGSRIVRRRVKVIDLDSDETKNDDGGMVHVGMRCGYEEKGKGSLVVDSGTVEKASDQVLQVIDLDSDETKNDDSEMVHVGMRCSYEEKGKGSLVVDSGTVEKASDQVIQMIDLDSDVTKNDDGKMVNVGKRYGYVEKGEGSLFVDSGTAEKALLDEIHLANRDAGGGDEDTGKGKLAVEGNWLSIGMPVAELKMDQAGGSSVLDEDGGCRGGMERREGRRYSCEEKGKVKLVVEGEWLSLGRCAVKFDEDLIDVEQLLDKDGFEEPQKTLQRESPENSQELTGWDKQMRLEEDRQRRLEEDRQLQMRLEENRQRRLEQDRQRRLKMRLEEDRQRRLENRERAKIFAPEFAFYKPEDEDWDDPYSQIYEREERLKDQQQNSSSGKSKSKSSPVEIHWKPLEYRKDKRMGQQLPPSLIDLCLRVLAENASEIESLEGVPDALLHQLSLYLSSSRKMGSHILHLLASNSPTEIRVRDCSWATEEQLKEIFTGSNTDNLTVLQLDLCGGCMPDYVLRSTLARSPNSLPVLTTISLRGAYRLSDDGLHALVSSAPLLSSVNLGQCSLLSATGIINLAEKLEPVLRKLYIDECQNIDASLILPAMKKLKNLEVLSVAGIPTICNKFVRELVSVCGPKLKELVFRDCRKLTAFSMKIIGERCPQLRTLDLSNLHKFNDSAIHHLANGCRSIQKLKLCRNAFSDEVIAAFLEASGDSLTELSLNNVRKVGHYTAIAISQRCSSNLQSLDLSFCREMTDEALGLIVDSCSSLRILKLFGCSQVTDTFLDGHSNSQVNIIGLKEPLLKLLQRPCFL